jgi:hypothetical protein
MLQIADRDPGLTPWAIIWRPLTGACKALITGNSFFEFPDTLGHAATRLSSRLD